MATSPVSYLEPRSAIPRGEARAVAGVNIALIKYWGKADEASNTPAVGSLSLTLDEWGSDTKLTWLESPNSYQEREHRFILNGEERVDHKVYRLLDHLLEVAEQREHPWASRGRVSALIESQNTVPTASGLASSASGMAALGLAAWSALGWETSLNDHQSEEIMPLIDSVRIGSGSAVRSLLGGIVRLERDGRSMTQLCPYNEWELALVVCVIDPGPKAVSSRAGMERTRQTSPFYKAWVDSHQADLDAATLAVKAREFDQLGTLMEHSTFKMHASMWASSPPLRYLRGETLILLDEVQRLRTEGISAWATMDAGPHVKVLCRREDAIKIQHRLTEAAGISEVIVRYPGGAPRVWRGVVDV